MNCPTCHGTGEAVCLTCDGTGDTDRFRGPLTDREIVVGFNEWLREYARDPESFRALTEDIRAAKAGEPLTYGDEALAILLKMAASALAREAR